MVAVVKQYYQDELKLEFDKAVQNYCSSLPAYIYAEKNDRPQPPKYEDYMIVSEEDEKNLELLEKLKDVMKTRIG